MIDIFQGIAFFNFIFFSILIWLYKDKIDYAIYIFSFFLLGKGLTLFSNLILTKAIFPSNETILNTGIVLNSFLFFYAPFLCFFALSVVYGAVSLKKYWIHFIPFVLFLLLNTIVVFARLTKVEESVFVKILDIRSTFTKLYYVQVVGYTIASIWVLHSYKSESVRFQKMSRWLKGVLIAFFTVWMLFLASSVTETNVNLSEGFTFSGVLLLLLLSNIVIIFLLNNPEFFYNHLSVKLQKLPDDKKATRAVYEKLCQLIVEQQLYKKADLKIGDLSEAIQESSRTVSKVINSHYGGNFNDFINSYRIEEAKKLLRNEDEEITILTILYEAGFNSKSVFNTVFKKMEGETPSSYRKKYLASMYG